MTDITLPAVHPGEILREEYLKPLGLSPLKLARMLGVPRTRVERLTTEKTAVSPDTAIRLAKAFGTTARFWLNMQSSYDLAITETDVSGIQAIEFSA